MSSYYQDSANMRAGDADRSRAAEILNEAYVYGRISKEDLDSRLAHVNSAPTIGVMNQALQGLVPNHPYPAQTATPYASYSGQYPAQAGERPADFTLTLVLAILLGPLGIHRFMTGYVGLGILYIFTGGLFGIGWLIDVIQLAANTYTDKYGRRLR